VNLEVPTAIEEFPHEALPFRTRHSDRHRVGHFVFVAHPDSHNLVDIVDEEMAAVDGVEPVPDRLCRAPTDTIAFGQPVKTVPRDHDCGVDPALALAT